MTGPHRHRQTDPQPQKAQNTHAPPLTENRFGSSNLIHMCIEMIPLRQAKLTISASVIVRRGVKGCRLVVAPQNICGTDEYDLLDFRTAHPLFTDSGKHRRTT